MTRSKQNHLPEIRRANKTGVATFFDVSLPTVEAWIRKGCPVVERGGRGIGWVMDLRAVGDWLHEGQTGAGGRDPESLPPLERKAWYDAEAKKRDLAERDRELVPRPEMERAISTAYAAVTQDLLAIPDQLERQHGVPVEVAAKVDAAICAAIDALRIRLAQLSPEVETA